MSFGETLNPNADQTELQINGAERRRRTPTGYATVAVLALYETLASCFKDGRRTRRITLKSDGSQVGSDEPSLTFCRSKSAPGTVSLLRGHSGFWSWSDARGRLEKFASEKVTDAAELAGNPAQRLLSLRSAPNEARTACSPAARRCPLTLACHSGERPLQDKDHSSFQRRRRRRRTTDVCR